MSSSRRRFELVMVDDSAEARSFIELSSYAVDLVEARDALELVLRSATESGSPLQSVERALIASATMAYCRTFFPSKVRPRLTEYVAIPQALAATHKLVGRYRNRTVAHSQSDLTVTYAVGVLDAETLEVLDVTAPTVSSTMPPEQVRKFLELVTAVMDQLDEAIEPIRRRLMEQIVAADRIALVRDGPRPQVQELLEADFDASTTRPSYPRSHPIYWTREVAD